MPPRNGSDHRCQQCGKVFYAPKNEEGRKYCSPECYRAFRFAPEKRTRQCAKCGRDYIADRKYCSTACARAAQRASCWKRGRVTVECEWCGKVFDRQKSMLRSKHTFCSCKCSGFWWSHYGMRGATHPAWRGGRQPAAYRTQWQRARKAAFAANDGSCELCKAMGVKLLVHHRIPITAFADPREANRLRNLQVVCHGCHSAIHRGSLRMSS